MTLSESCAPSSAHKGSAAESRARSWWRTLAQLLAWPLIVLVRAYQVLVSPFLPAACRFYPTCSEYARLSLTRHGLWRGVWLSARRVARCHPGHAGGDDPVPD